MIQACIHKTDGHEEEEEEEEDDDDDGSGSTRGTRQE